MRFVNFGFVSKKNMLTLSGLILELFLSRISWPLGTVDNQAQVGVMAVGCPQVSTVCC